MRIGELAGEAGVSTRALRYYEQRGLLASRRRGNGYREYEETAVNRVLNIRALLDAGLNADGIRELDACLDADFDHVGGCRTAVALYEERLLVVRGQLAALAEVEALLEAKLGQLREQAVGASR